MLSVKVLAFLLVIAFCVSCNSVESIETLGEYDIPISPSLKELRYAFVVSPESDTIVHHYFLNYDSNIYTISQFNYLNGEPSFERHYQIISGRKKLLKEFYYEYPGETNDTVQKIEGEIINFKSTNNERKYEDLKVDLSFTNTLGFRTVFSETEEYEKDTTLLWKNELHEAIKFKYTTSKRTFIKYLPFIGSPNNSSGGSYYARGVGLVRYTFWIGSAKYTSQLISMGKK